MSPPLRAFSPLGIDLLEARFVPDVEAEIVAAVNALRPRYAYVFTTGGIGPTHDDITADAIGAAFGVCPWSTIPRPWRCLRRATSKGSSTNAGSAWRACLEGASLIKNPVSVAPGFQIGNVFVMAGVPKIMQAMLEDVAPRLARGVPVTSRSLTVRLPEGRIAEGLAAIQTAHPSVTIGSYPFFADSGPGGGTAGTTLVVRGRDRAEVEAAERDIAALAISHGVQPEQPETQGFTLPKEGA